ncbi:MAG: MOSC domain-containing protein [Thermoplasmata archaeon]
MPSGRVVGVFVKGDVPREVGLPKIGVGEIRLGAAGAAGDFNHYRQEHLRGDPDSAVLLLPHEIVDVLRAEGWPVGPGDLGENLGLRGIPWHEFRSGRLVRVGDAELRLTRECTPCSRLAHLSYVGDTRLAEFLRATLGRRGFYARVLREGSVRVGDPVDLE